MYDARHDESILGSCPLPSCASLTRNSPCNASLGPSRAARSADAAIPPARVKAKRYLNSALLIVDEVGFRPLDRMEANLFFHLVSARYEWASIILTTSKHVRDWPDVFAGDEILATAILDRLLHHLHIVHIDGRSYRPRQLDQLLWIPTAPAPSLPTDGGAPPTKPRKPGA